MRARAVLVAAIGATVLLGAEADAGERRRTRPRRTTALRVRGEPAEAYWAAGSPVEIAWRQRGRLAASRVRVELSRDGGATWTEIARPPAHARQFEWAVEGDLGDADVRVTTLDGRRVSRPRHIQITSPVRQIAVAYGFAVAVHEDGRLRIWGGGPGGIPLDGEHVELARPATFPFLENVRSVHAGGEQFVAILEDGSAWHWGFNTTSSLASGTWNAVPARIAGIEDAVWARASLARLFIRVADGRVFGLTGNAGGPMWDDPDAPVVLPIGVATEVAELHGVVDIGLGMQHGLALREDGTVLSWGSNGDGQLGDPGARRSRPAPVPGLDDVVAIAAGDWSGMALRADGTVWRWGYGNLVAAYVEGRDRSELPHDTASPVMVPGIDRIVAVGGIDAAEYALRDDGALFGWGGNTLGHWEGAPVIPPAQVPIPPVRVFFIGQAGSIHALTRDGRRLAWGNNYSFTVGNGGNGVYRAQWSPTPIYSP